MLFFFTFIFPILLGGFIGLFTNYLAIKMLFKPYKSIYIGRLRIPFTPGLIPKEKQRIASSLATVISNEFFNKAVLYAYLTNETFIVKLKTIIVTSYQNILNEYETVKDYINSYLKEDSVNDYIKTLKQKITNLLFTKFKEHNLSNVIARSIVDECMLNDSIISKTINLFFSSKTKDNIIELLESKIEKYMENTARIEFENILEIEFENLLYKNLKGIDIDINYITNFVLNIYKKIIELKIDDLIKIMDLETLIYDHINGLDIKELESIILKITKKELRLITVLGGLLGAILGVFNIII